MFEIETDDREARKHAAKREYQNVYRKTDKARATKRATRKSITDAKYLARRIVAIDGEGLNVRRGPRKGDHDYVLLAISDTKPIMRREGLPTGAILKYLFDNLRSDDLNVIYGGSYDFNCWIKDFPADEVARIYRGGFMSRPVYFGKYGVRWTKGKSFEICRVGSDKKVVINDVVSFFQSSFVQACDDYLGDYEHRDTLVAMKAKRGNFTWAEISAVTEYNDLELDLIVKLVGELRERLNRVGLRPRRWIGPGAIAATLFIREGIKAHRNTQLPDEVSRAARFAYAGGRFEVIKYGASSEPAWEYDVNSAYPCAFSEVPTLAGGSWEHWAPGKTPPPLKPFALYRVRYSGTNPRIPGPLFTRGPNGTISYPLRVTNWIWTPEYRTLIQYCEQIEGAEFEVLEAWLYTPPSDVKPFGFIGPLFEKRRELKRAGDGAHVGIKLGLNSMYGKLAQQVGWAAATAKHPLRVPTYHQLEWAGYATSWCRAEVLKAALTDIENVIAFETDALFTSAPLNVKEGENLGEWESTEFANLTYVQSGHYYGTTSDGKEVVKCRGIDRGFINRRNVEKALRLPESQRVLSASLTRFYGAGIALARGLNKYWRKWLTEPKVLQLAPTGKRVHGACWCTSDSLIMGVWHNTYCPIAGGVSSEYPIAWINPNPEMATLEELREQENHYEDD